MPRRSPRAQVQLAGSILYGDGEPKVCLVTNISRRGAKLSLSVLEDLPYEFTLRVPGAEHRSRLVWRAGLEAGVELVG